MPQIQEIPQTKVIPFRKLTGKNAQVKRKPFYLTAIAQPKPVAAKIPLQAEEPELPFEKWIMPPQPKGYIKCGGCEWF